MGPKDADIFRDCQITLADGRTFPLRIDSVNFNPDYIGPEITAYLLEIETIRNRVRRSNDPIEKVIFNDPATVVIWKDKTKTVVKCQPGDTYSPELGLAMCIAKKYLGNKGNFNEVFKKWIPEEKAKETIVATDTEGNVIKSFEVPKSEISIEEKRQKLMDHCKDSWCSTCPLYNCNRSCGRGYTFIDPDGNTYDEVSDEEVERSYKIVFGKED